MAYTKHTSTSETRATVKWKAPAATEIKIGEELCYYSNDCRFNFTVQSIEHKGEWLFGEPIQNLNLLLGPISVRRVDCMTPAQANVVLKDVPVQLPFDARANEGV